MPRNNDRELGALADLTRASRPQFDISAFYLFLSNVSHNRRRDAAMAMDSFLKQTDRWSGERRLAFVIWFFSIVEGAQDTHVVLTQPLKFRLLLPTLRKWRMDVPSEPRACRWLGLFFENPEQENNLNEAIRLGGRNEQRAISKLVNKTLYALWYDTHHLPKEYLGDPNDDMERLRKADELAQSINDRRARDGVMTDLNTCRRSITNWIDFQSSGEDSFDAFLALREEEKSDRK